MILIMFVADVGLFTKADPAPAQRARAPVPRLIFFFWGGLYL